MSLAQFRIAVAAVVLLLPGRLLAVDSNVPPEMMVHGFQGGPSDGATPWAPPVIGPDGLFYGTTGSGGAFGAGTVYQLKPPAITGGKWEFTSIYSFRGDDGAAPIAPPLLSQGGVLYGTTSVGGAFGYGAVYKLEPPSPTSGGLWTETTIYSFMGDHDGVLPESRLISDQSGRLYGTTLLGGIANSGTLFSLAPPPTPGGTWTETVLYTFNGLGDGGYPNDLTLGGNGELYGTTRVGGNVDGPCRQSGCGTVFQFVPPAEPGSPWAPVILHDFQVPGHQGSFPYAPLVLGRGGALFGSTYYGGVNNCGLVFKLMPSTQAGTAWIESVLHDFTGSPADGCNVSGLIFAPSSTGQVVYGTTNYGGVYGSGTIFKMVPPSVSGGEWTESIAYSFTNSNVDGSVPNGLVLGSTALYGVTVFGGPHLPCPSIGCGTVFKFVP